jgi:hypothetical protein
MPVQAKAGDNEKKFEALFISKVVDTPLLGKRRFKLAAVNISVDQSFEFDGVDYLVEIDSGNMAKLIVGQYVLLNQLRKLERPAFFMVVHAYKNYNPMRTVQNLNLVNRELFGGNGMPFGAVHMEDLTKWDGGVPSLHGLLKCTC